MRESVHKVMGTKNLVRLWAKKDDKKILGSFATVEYYEGEGFYKVITRPDQCHLIVMSEDIALQ